ncbi:MAG: hypothetical protein ACJ71Z_08255 [Aeromicrobium sp.]
MNLAGTFDGLQRHSPPRATGTAPFQSSTFAWPVHGSIAGTAVYGVAAYDDIIGSPAAQWDEIDCGAWRLRWFELSPAGAAAMYDASVGLPDADTLAVTTADGATRSAPVRFEPIVRGAASRTLARLAAGDDVWTVRGKETFVEHNGLPIDATRLPTVVEVVREGSRRVSSVGRLDTPVPELAH